MNNENNKNCIEINTNNLIVLCEIFEDYKAFYEDLEELINQIKKKDLVTKVYDYNKLPRCKHTRYWYALLK